MEIPSPLLFPPRVGNMVTERKGWEESDMVGMQYWSIISSTSVDTGGTPHTAG